MNKFQIRATSDDYQVEAGRVSAEGAYTVFYDDFEKLVFALKTDDVILIRREDAEA